MAVFDDISKALKGIMLDNDFSLPVIYENAFDEAQPIGTAFLAIFQLPAQPTQATLGDAGCDLHTGIFQIDINYPSGEGMALLVQKADEINAVIKSGATFTNNGLNVRINNVGISRLVVSDGLATINITIEYNSFSTRV